MIRAAELVDDTPPPLFPEDEVLAWPANDGDQLVLRLFGTLPDYSKAAIRALAEEVMASDPSDLFDWLVRHGIDVLDDDGQPVRGWRDIAILMLAADRGLIERAS